MTIPIAPVAAYLPRCTVAGAGVVESVHIPWPTAVAPTLGGELLGNPGLEGAYVAGLAPNFALKGTPTVDEEGTIIHGGSAAQKVTTSGDNEGVSADTVAIVLGTHYQVSCYGFLPTVGNSTSMRMGRTNANITTPTSSDLAILNAWTEIVGVVRCIAANPSSINMHKPAGLADGIFYVDDVSMKPITLSTTLGTPQDTGPYGTWKVGATLLSGTQQGVIVCVDNPYVPRSFVLAYHDGVNAILEKCVAGTYANLISTAATYAAGRVPEVRRALGTNTFQLFYNGTQIGTNQTINDAQIIGNRWATWWSTFAGNTFRDFMWSPT